MKRKQPTKTTDRIFCALFWLAILAGVGAAIAWALGWEFGWIGVLMAGAFAGIPLFHFAMHWPMRDRENSVAEKKKDSL